MSFDVDVTPQAFDALPSISNEAFDRLVELLSNKLGNDPLACSRRAVHPAIARPGNVYFDGFELSGRAYLFAAYFWIQREARIVIWDLQLTVEHVS